MLSGKALAEFTAALQLAPDSDLANYYYGTGLTQAGQTAQASVAFKKAATMTKNKAVKAAAEEALK